MPLTFYQCKENSSTKALEIGIGYAMSHINTGNKFENKS